MTILTRLATVYIFVFYSTSWLAMADLLGQPAPASNGLFRATVVLTGKEGVSGKLFFAQQANGPTTITGALTGLTPGLHGFHVHTLGDASDGCLNIGPHFNPSGKEHGAPEDLNRHAGDLGNVVADENGTATVSIMDSQIPLTGADSIVGRAIDVHADPDDLGKGGVRLSKITGNAGDRVACGVVGLQA